MRSNAKIVFGRIAKKLDRAFNDLPKVLANTGQQHFNKTYASQKSDNGYEWPNVKRRMGGSNAFKYPKNKYLSRRTNPILIGKTRRLKNAVSRSIKRVDKNQIIWGVFGKEGEYGFYHNNGVGQKRRAFMHMTPNLQRLLSRKAQQIYRTNLK